MTDNVQLGMYHIVIHTKHTVMFQQIKPSPICYLNSLITLKNPVTCLSKVAIETFCTPPPSPLFYY